MMRMIRAAGGYRSKGVMRIGAVALSGLLAVGAAAIGCTSALGEADDVTAEQSETQAEPRFEQRLATVLAELELTPAQRAETDVIVRDLGQALSPVHEAKRAAGAQLAADVRKGTIDDAAMDAKIGDLKAALTTAKPKWQEAANRLHATLTEDQRETLVETFHDRFHDRRSHRRERMEQIADELELTDDQRDQIKDALRAEMRSDRREHARERMRAMRDRVEELVEAFESDDFDAVTLDLGGQALEAVDHGAEVMVRITEIALDVLDDGQRDRLAEIIERRIDG